MEQAWIQAAIAAVVGSLATAVVYLFKENRKLAESESLCNQRMAEVRAELVSLYALVQQMQWSGSMRLEAVVVADMSSGMITEWNPGATILLHWTEREMLGKSIGKIVPPKYRDRHEEAVRSVMKGGNLPSRGPIIGHALTKDGVEVPVEITLSGWKVGNSSMMAASIKRRITTSSDTGEIPDSDSRTSR